nr:uncharacterized protein LOC117683102 [Crassostrea gigas]
MNLRNRKGDQKDDDSHGIGKIASGVLRETDSELPKPVFSTGVIIGAVLGGAVFGSVITMIVFLCFCQTRIDPQNRNSDSKPESDETLQEHLRPGDNENVYSEINDQVHVV